MNQMNYQLFFCDLEKVKLETDDIEKSFFLTTQQLIHLFGSLKKTFFLKKTVASILVGCVPTCVYLCVCVRLCAWVCTVYVCVWKYVCLKKREMNGVRIVCVCSGVTCDMVMSILGRHVY